MRRSLVLVFLLAAAIRLLYLAYDAPFFLTEYWDLAGNLIAHGRLGFNGGRSTDYEPLYPALLAAARLVSGDRVLLVQAIQALMAAAGAAATYSLAEALTKRPALAAMAALLFAAEPVLVRHAVAPGELAVAATLLAMFAFTFVTASTPRRGAAAGVWLGLAILTRMVALPLVLLAPIIASRARRRAAAVCALTAAAIVSPWFIRNYLINGSLLPTRGGINLFIGNSRYAAALLPDYSPDILQEHARTLAARHGLTLVNDRIADEKQADELFTKAALVDMRAHPEETLLLKLRNAACFFSPFLVPRHVLTDETTITLDEATGAVRIANAPIRPALERVVYTISSTAILAAAMVGIWRRRAAGRRRDGILWAALGVFVAAAIVYFPATRYRAPVEFVLLFYAAVGLDYLVESYRAPSSTAAPLP